MPNLDPIQVSLSDALEVQGCPLRDYELWSVLCQSVETIQDIFLKNEALVEDGPSFVVSPYTLILCSDGHVTFTESIDVRAPDIQTFLPPERGSMRLTIAAVEKMYIYALGQTLVWASQFNSAGPLRLGQNLQVILTAMCNPDPGSRISLVHILEACSLHSQHVYSGMPYSHHIIRLNKLILGSVDELDKISIDNPVINTNENNGNQRDVRIERGFLQKSSGGQQGSGFPMTSQNKRPHSSRGHSSKRGKDETDIPSRGRQRPLNLKDTSYCSSSTYDSAENARPRKKTFLQRSLESPANFDLDHSISDGLPPKSSQSKVERSRSALGKSGSLRSSREMRKDALLMKSSLGSRGLSGRSRSRSPPSRETWSSRSNMVYDRMRERRERLRVLREQLGIQGRDPPYAFPDDADEPVIRRRNEGRSLETRSRSFKSITSLESAQEGSYCLGQNSQYSSATALNEGDSIDVGRPSHFHRFHDAPEEHGRQVRESRTLLDPSRNVSPPRRKSKRVLGPEFVVMSSSPNEVIDMAPSALCKAGKVPPDKKKVTVVLLNGKRLDLMCDLGTSGQDLFDLVTLHLDLSEKNYFGLSHFKDGEYYFLDSDVKVYKVGPESWREEQKRGSRKMSSREKLNLFFRVKFYVDDANILKTLDPPTGHHFYLQVRRDILEERTKCDEGEALQLASLALQAEMGDYEEQGGTQNYFLPEHYVPASIVDMMGVGAIKRRLPSLHKSHKGLSEEAAEMGFIMESRKLPEYGIHFHRVTRAKKTANQTVWLGVCSRGVIIFDKRGPARVKLHSHPWTMTKKVAFKRRKFVIEPNDRSGQRFVHYTDSYKKGKYLLQLCKAQHKFHMTTRARSLMAKKANDDYPESIQMERVVQPSHFASQTDFDDDVQFSDGGNNISDSEFMFQDANRFPVSDEPNNPDYATIDSFKRNNQKQIPSQRTPQTLPGHYQRSARGPTLPGHYQGSTEDKLSRKIQNSRMIKTRSMDTGQQLLANNEDDILGVPRPLRNVRQAYVMESETSLDEVDGYEYSRRGRWSEESLPKRWNLGEDKNEGEEEAPYATIDSIRQRKKDTKRNLPLRENASSIQNSGSEDRSPVHDGSSHIRSSTAKMSSTNRDERADDLRKQKSRDHPVSSRIERDINIVTLKKEKDYGLGLIISGGESPSDLAQGIFVKEVTPGGPAARDGQLHPGDRIISINGESLEGVSHKVAVDTMKNAPDLVQLIVSQPRKKGASVSAQEGQYMNIHISQQELANENKQTPPMKPRRKPETFGSSYSLVHSDVDQPTEDHPKTVKSMDADKSQGLGVQRDQQFDAVLAEISQSQQKLKRSSRDGGDTQTDIRVSENSLEKPQTRSLPVQPLKSSPRREGMTVIPQKVPEEHLKPSVASPSHEVQDSNSRNKLTVTQKTNKSVSNADIFDMPVEVDFKASNSDLESDADQSEDIPTPNSSDIDDLFGDLDNAHNLPLDKPAVIKPKTQKEVISPHEKEKNSRINQAVPKETAGVGQSSSGNATSPQPEDKEIQEIEAALKPGDRFTVQLRKVKDSLGISVTGGINTSVKHGGIYVKTMVPGGAADLEGQIKAGDRILEVNKVSLIGVTHKQAVEVLRHVPETSTLLVEKGYPPTRVTTLPPTPVNLESEDQRVQDAPYGEGRGHNTGAARDNHEYKMEVDAEVLPSGPADVAKLLTSVLDERPLSQASMKSDATTPSIEAIDDADGSEISSDDEKKIEDGSESEGEGEGDKRGSSGEEEEEESSKQSEDETDEFEDDFYAEIASPALSTREADTLTPTAHLVTPTRGLFALRGTPQERVRNQRHWTPRMSTDEGWSSAMSEHTNARSPSPLSSSQREDDVQYKPGFNAYKRRGSGAETDIEKNLPGRKSKSPFDVGRKPLEIEPSSLPIMEEELMETDAPVQASQKESTHPQKRADQGEFQQEARDDGIPSSPVTSSHDTSLYNPPNDLSMMSPMSTLSSVGALTLTQTIMQDPDETTDMALPDVPYANIDNSFEVTLSKGAQGLGFSVQGGQGAHTDPRYCVVRIKKVFPGQAAAASGLIEEGDVILAVNGEHVYNLSHPEVVSKLRTSPQTVKLLLCRPNPDELDSLLHQVFQHTETPTKAVPPSPIKKDLTKVLSSPMSNVTSPFSSPPMSPTSQSLEDISFSQSRNPSASKLSSSSESSPRKVGETEVVKVTLMKPVRGGLGFTVAGGVNTGGCYIKDIISDPALADGRLKKGDRILAVNDKDMRSMNHFDAVSFLRLTPR